MEEKTTLVLVRHGETAWNKAGRIQGQRDVPLSEEGLRQAALLGQRLSGAPLAAVYSSDLARARRTAEEIAARRALAVEVVPALREMSYGRWEGLTLREVEERFPEELARYRQDGLHTVLTGGESALQMRERVLAAVEEILRRRAGQVVAVVSHTGPIKMILAQALGLDPAQRWRLAVDNASLSVVEYGPRGPVVRLCNDVGHLRDLLAPQDRPAPRGAEA
ncbi:MAG: alpha-ribazole phosphatase [Bacillota bacterium]|nr:alpha-ribazole phosphatase [Bacillota bacterium]